MAGTCDAYGACVCHSDPTRGFYSGAACEAPVCNAACENGSTCVGPDQCDCAGTGYEGETCETPVCVAACLNGGTCSAPDTCDCSGTGYGGATCQTALCGGAAAEAPVSCAAIHATCPGLGSNSYYIDPNGGSSADAFLVYCDMSTLTGGWTVIVGPANPYAHCDAYQSNGGTCNANLMSSSTASTGQTFCGARGGSGYNNSFAYYCFDQSKFAGMPVSQILFTNSNSSSCGQPWGARWYDSTGASSPQYGTGSNVLISGVSDLGLFDSEVGCPGYTNLTFFAVR